MLPDELDAELTALRARVARALADDDTVMSDAEIDRLEALKSQERSLILNHAGRRRIEQACRGVERIKLALARQSAGRR
jgi:hypothetical protein